MSKLTYERAKQLYTPYDEGQMRHLCALRDVEIDRLRAENFKLRELARLLLWGIDNDMPRYEELAWTQKVNVLVRELGVEVE